MAKKADIEIKVIEPTNAKPDTAIVVMASAGVAYYGGIAARTKKPVLVPALFQAKLFFPLQEGDIRNAEAALKKAGHKSVRKTVGVL